MCCRDKRVITTISPASISNFFYNYSYNIIINKSSNFRRLYHTILYSVKERPVTLKIFLKQNYQEFAVRSYLKKYNEQLKSCKYLKGCSTSINAILAYNYAAHKNKNARI